MSDSINPSNFKVVWEGIMQEAESMDALQEGEIVNEISAEEFFETFGFHPSLLDDGWGNTSLDVETDAGTDIPKAHDSSPVQSFEKREVSSSVHSSPAQPSDSATTLDALKTDDQPEKCQDFLNLDINEVNQFIKNQENKNTSKKTLSDINKFEKFLKLKGEKKEIQNIDVDLLDVYVATFVLSVKNQDGKDFEPSSLRNIISSIDRKLRRQKYPYTIMNSSGPQFSLTRDAFAAKAKSLKKCGKGNKPREAPPISDNDIDKMYQKDILGLQSPRSLLNTIWLNNCIHFGLRGTTEQYNLRWGDVTLKQATTGEEYLELNERQTKTRTGENLTDVTPKMFASVGERDPVAAYKLYAEKRPTGFSEPEDAFYLAPRTTPIGNNEKCQWFMKQRLGEKKIGSMLKTMATGAKLSNADCITNHSARKHLIQKLRDSNIPPTEIMQISGHKNVQSILNYSGMSEKNQKKCSNLLSSSSSTESVACMPAPSHTYAIDEVAASASNSGTSVVPADMNTSHPTHSQTMSMSTSNSISSKLFGAVFHVQNFNVYN